MIKTVTVVGTTKASEDCYMPRDSVGAEDGDSCAYIQGGKDCYMPQDVVGDEDGDS